MADHNKPYIFNNEQIYEKMKKEIFVPAINKFNVPKEEQPYIIEFFTRGVVGIVSAWLQGDCNESIDNIVNIILNCVGLKK